METRDESATPVPSAPCPTSAALLGPPLFCRGARAAVLPRPRSRARSARLGAVAAAVWAYCTRLYAVRGAARLSLILPPIYDNRRTPVA